MQIERGNQTSKKVGQQGCQSSTAARREGASRTVSVAGEEYLMLSLSDVVSCLQN